MDSTPKLDLNLKAGRSFDDNTSPWSLKREWHPEAATVPPLTSRPERNSGILIGPIWDPEDITGGIFPLSHHLEETS